MAIPFLPAPTWTLPLLLLFGSLIFILILKAVEKLMFIIMMITTEIGFAGILYYFYFPELVAGYESLGTFLLYPFIFYDKSISLLIGVDESLIYSCIIALGLLWFYTTWLLRKKLGIVAPVISGVILFIMGAGLPGLRLWLNSIGIAWIFYGIVILISAGIIGWKFLSKK